VSRDGSRLAYSVLAEQGERRAEIHLRDLATGRDTVPVSLAFDLGGTYTRLSPDARWLAWPARVGDRWSTFVAPVGEPAGREVCRACGPVAFLSDLSALVVDLGPDGLGRVVLPDGGEPARLVTLPEGWLLLDADLSPDEHRVALSLGLPDGRMRIVVVPLGSAPVSAEEGILVADGRSWASSPRWAPDGRFLYYLSDRDGFNCVWATPFGPGTKRPAGEPFAALHAHRTEMKMTAPSKGLFALSVSARGLILSAAEISGEIYTALLEPPG
jgi:hypothetical protein